jgi:hypothetical protein
VAALAARPVARLGKIGIPVSTLPVENWCGYADESSDVLSGLSAHSPPSLAIQRPNILTLSAVEGMAVFGVVCALMAAINAAATWLSVADTGAAPDGARTDPGALAGTTVVGGGPMVAGTATVATGVGATVAGGAVVTGAVVTTTTGGGAPVGADGAAWAALELAVVDPVDADATNQVPTTRATTAPTVTTAVRP